MLKLKIIRILNHALLIIMLARSRNIMNFRLLIVILNAGGLIWIIQADTMSFEMIFCVICELLLTKVVSSFFIKDSWRISIKIWLFRILLKTIWISRVASNLVFIFFIIINQAASLKSNWVSWLKLGILRWEPSLRMLITICLRLIIYNFQRKLKQTSFLANLIVFTEWGLHISSSNLINLRLTVVKITVSLGAE